MANTFNLVVYRNTKSAYITKTRTINNQHGDTILDKWANYVRALSSVLRILGYFLWGLSSHECRNKETKKMILFRKFDCQ